MYYAILAKCKERIYMEYLPNNFPVDVRNANCPIDQLYSYFKNNNTNINLILLDDAFDEAKKSRYLYYPFADNHWNDYGAYIAYAELMKTIRKQFPDVPFVKEKVDFSWEEVSIAHDGIYEPVAQFEKEINLEIEGITTQIDTIIKRQSYIKFYPWMDKDYVRKSKVNNLKVLIFRSSYSVSMMPFLDRTFGECRYILHPLIDINVVESYKPDIVMQISVETSHFSFAKACNMNSPESDVKQAKTTDAVQIK